MELETAPPPQRRPGAMDVIPYLVVLGKTRAAGAVVRNSFFEDSLGFFGRWKSSDSRLENNVFRGAGAAQLQVMSPMRMVVTLAHRGFVRHHIEICCSTHMACGSIYDAADADAAVLL